MDDHVDTSPVAAPGAETVPAPEHRRAVRLVEEGWLGGVCAGLAAHLGWPVLALRLALAVLTAVGFVSIPLYALLWLALPQATAGPEAPGLVAAGRAGLRDAEAAPSRAVDVGSFTAISLVGGGLLWLVQAMGWGMEERFFWPVLVASGGMGLIWWQADHISGRVIRGRTGWARWFAPLVAHWSTIVMIGLGFVLTGVAIWLLMAALPGLGEVSRTLVLVGLCVGSIAVAAAPWLLRVRRLLAQMREEKLLADARADMAAHLHDSVLQTLALIQRQADDPKAVARLARRQERELRGWLYGEPESEATLAAALTAAAAEVEDTHGVEVDVVTVGDCPLTPELDAMVRAANEAMVNAASHSGAPQVDVFAEVGEDSVEVFVRDRGRGFDPSSIADDRLGVRKSIVERMRRYAGAASIRSQPGEGTEVRLEMIR